MNCEPIYFVCGVIQYASLHWCSSILCTSSLYCLLDNSKNISSSLPISYFCCKLIYHFRRRAFDNSGIRINHCLIWTLVCTKTPCSVYSGSDWKINLNPSNQCIFHNLITCSAHPWLWLCCRCPRIVPNSVWNSDSSIINELQTPCQCHWIQYVEDKNVETYRSSDKQLFLHISLQNTKWI